MKSYERAARPKISDRGHIKYPLGQFDTGYSLTSIRNDFNVYIRIDSVSLRFGENGAISSLMWL